MIGESIYQRAALSAGNMFSGNVDAATAALFAPMDLSPDEVKTLQDKLTEGGKHAENPLIKTALALASNPILWLGIVLAVGPWGKVRDIKNLAAVMQEGKQYMREVHPWMRALTSPFTSLRDLWHTGVIDKLLKVVGNTAEFQARHNETWQGLVRSAQSSLGRVLTERERRLVGAYLEGWHLPGSPLATAFPNALGGKVLAPGLEKAMEPPILDLAKGLRKLLDDAGAEVILNHEGEVLPELAEKGVEWVGTGYGVRLTQRMGIEKFLAEGMGGATRDYRNMLRSMGPLAARAKATYARQGWSLPNEGDVDLIKDVLTPEAHTSLMTLGKRAQENLRSLLSSFTEGIRSAQMNPNLSPVGQETIFANIVEGLGASLKGLGANPKVAGGLVAELRHRLEVDPGSVETFIEAVSQRIGPSRFTMDPYKYIPRYIRTMGPTYAWISKGGGQVLDDIFDKKGKYAYVVKGWQRDMYTDNLRPALRGLQTPKEYARRLWFDDSKMKVREWLGSESPIVRMIPASTRQWILKGLEGGLSEQTVGGKIASLLYVSSLGANLSPVYKNLFQNFITTMNYVGPGNMAKGMGVVASKLGDLSKEMGKGVKFEQAFKAAFPEYYERFGYEHMLRAMAAGDIAREATTATTVARNVYEKIARGLMAPFAASEKLNRLWAFYATHTAAIEAGLAVPEAGKVARNLTLLTQFGGGALGIPTAIRNLPVPLRQFSHFPLRYLEWLYGSMAFGPDPAKLSTGVIGRTMAGSAGLYEIFKNLVGIDVSSALAFGALPYPSYGQASLFPFPIVPPAVGMTADIAKALATGQYEGVGGKTAAMLTPGGLAARRAWKTWSPRYVGYDQRGPDGRYPVYNKEGALLFTQSPMQIVMRGLGLRTDDVVQEQATIKWLLAQRDKIRIYRQKYVEAVANGDMETAQSIQNQFKKKYPSLGEIQFKKSDLTAINNRRQLTRVQRILKNFPTEYRPIFEQAASLGMVGHLGQAIDTTGGPGFTF